MTGAHQISANVLAAADEIAQLLPLDRRDRHDRQLPCSQRPGEPDRVALVGLEPVARRPVGSVRSADDDLDPLGTGAAREPVAGRACLVDHARRARHRPQERQQHVRPPEHPLRAHLTGGLVKDSDRRFVRVHVNTDPMDTVRHRRHLLVDVWPASKLEPSMRTQPPSRGGADYLRHRGGRSSIGSIPPALHGRRATTSRRHPAPPQARGKASRRLVQAGDSIGESAAVGLAGARETSGPLRGRPTSFRAR